MERRVIGAQIIWGQKFDERAENANYSASAGGKWGGNALLKSGRANVPPFHTYYTYYSV